MIRPISCAKGKRKSIKYALEEKREIRVPDLTDATDIV